MEKRRVDIYSVDDLSINGAKRRRYVGPIFTGCMVLAGLGIWFLIFLAMIMGYKIP